MYKPSFNAADFQRLLNRDVAAYVYKWSTHIDKANGISLYDGNGSWLGICYNPDSLLGFYDLYVPKWSTDIALALDLAKDVGINQYNHHDNRYGDFVGPCWSIYRGLTENGFFGLTLSETICAAAIEIVKHNPSWKPPLKNTKVEWSM